MKTGGGTMDIFFYLNPQGENKWDLPKHPYVDYSKEEKLAFRQCFGAPLQIPKDLNRGGGTIKEFLDKLDERRNLMRECAAMTKHSQFRLEEGQNRKRGRDKTPRKSFIKNE